MRSRWLGWLVVAGAVTGVACGGPGGTDSGPPDTPVTPPDASDVAQDVAQDAPQDTPITPMDVPQDTPITPMDVPQDTPITPMDVPQDTPITPMDVTPDMVVMPPMARTTQTNGSAVALSADDRIAVAVNRTANNVSVFSTNLSAAPPTATRTGTPISTGAGSEPWAAVLSGDGNTAYVILRHDRAVVRISNLRTTPTLDTPRAATGSEPTGIAITPTGARLYVANWAEGTVTIVDTATMAVTGSVDLNAALAAAPVLGTGVTSRPGLAHPRAIVITNNADTSDADETVFVTEFFAHNRGTGVPTDDTRFDLARQGVVYRFNVGTGTVGPLTYLAPVANTGFQDSEATNTGCFPNQLYAAQLNNNRLYVTALCESPRGNTGPITVAGVTSLANFKTQIHTGIFVVDTTAPAELASQGLLLTQRFQQEFDGMGGSVPPRAMVADDGVNRRIPLIANDIAFVPGTSTAYVTSYGSDAVFRVRYNADGSFNEVGSSTQRFINLNPGGGIPAGQLPIGIAIANTAGVQTAVVLSENSRNLSLVNLNTQSVAAAVESAPPPTAGSPEAHANTGHRFFATGLGRWSLRGQGWNSCETCHPDGLTDNVTWFFGRGPRQTVSLDGSYSPDGTRRRLYNWTAIFDETHDFENNTRGNSGGVGAVVHANSAPPVNGDRIIFDGTAPVAPQMPTATNQSGLNGAVTSLMPGGATTPNSVLADWNDIDSHIKTIRAPRGLTTLNATAVMNGRTQFEAGNCTGCHGGPSWTISRVFYTPNEANNAAMGLLRMMNYTAPAMFPMALNPATNLAGRAAPLRFTNADPMVQNANDQINCVLRAVGTFPATLDAMMTGVVPSGSNAQIREVRSNMATPAQGASGFNPPSLFGMATGAPYFHAGNARTLEELFSTFFQTHYQALGSNVLITSGAARDTEVQNFIAFLLSIEDTTPVGAAPTTTFATDLCPTIP